MSSSAFPVPLARAAMNLMPQAVLRRGVEIVTRRMESRHPKLFQNLARLPSALVHLVPTDVAHGFGLTMGETVSFFVLDDETAGPEPDARIEGSLEALVEMLEGRVDGDTLFFARDIQLTGHTETIVSLRNTLDREEIDLYEEITSLCGPFAKQAGWTMSFIDAAARRVKSHLAALHDDLHKRQEKGTV